MLPLSNQEELGRNHHRAFGDAFRTSYGYNRVHSGLYVARKTEGWPTAENDRKRGNRENRGFRVVSLLAAHNSLARNSSSLKKMRYAEMRNGCISLCV